MLLLLFVPQISVPLGQYNSTLDDRYCKDNARSFWHPMKSVAQTTRNPACSSRKTRLFWYKVNCATAFYQNLNISWA